MKQKKSAEDYLKVIYILSKKKEVHGSDIAGELKVSRPTVSVALKALAEEGYVFVDNVHEGSKMHCVHLTERGMWVAEDTCEMGHIVSRESHEALKRLL